ncbi:MAG: 30S ribosomal protein S5 [Candidatus Pacearchaeota archaeon]|nr:30S ribosomal protein S5 [Candidatus Pacearchaeota archaeon]
MRPRRKRRPETLEEKREARERYLGSWSPRTQLGKQILKNEIKDIDQIFDSNFKILEPEIVDSLLPGLEMELINIGQSKGKFGGGKRRVWRQTQKKTAEGNVPTFACMVIVGDKNGHIGMGYGRAKETLPAKQKAIRQAKLNLIKIRRGCGSFECTCGEQHSIPFKVEGKVGSVRVLLMPAPRGTGLVADKECQKVLKLAGIKDIYTRSFGQTRTKINMIKAYIEALKKLNEVI